MKLFTVIHSQVSLSFVSVLFYFYSFAFLPFGCIHSLHVGLLLLLLCVPSDHSLIRIVVLKVNLPSSTILLFRFIFAPLIFRFKVAVARREEIIKRQDEAIRSLEVIL